MLKITSFQKLTIVFEHKQYNEAAKTASMFIPELNVFCMKTVSEQTQSNGHIGTSIHSISSLEWLVQHLCLLNSSFVPRRVLSYFKFKFPLWLMAFQASTFFFEIRRSSDFGRDYKYSLFHSDLLFFKFFFAYVSDVVSSRC